MRPPLRDLRGKLFLVSQVHSLEFCDALPYVLDGNSPPATLIATEPKKPFTPRPSTALRFDSPVVPRLEHHGRNG